MGMAARGDNRQQQFPPLEPEPGRQWARAGTGTDFPPADKGGVSHGRAPGSLKRPLRNQLIRMQTDTRPHSCPCGRHTPTRTHSPPPLSPLSSITHLQCPPGSFLHLSPGCLSLSLPTLRRPPGVPTALLAACSVEKRGQQWESGDPPTESKVRKTGTDHGGTE